MRWDELTRWLDEEVYPRLDHTVVFADLADFRSVGTGRYIARCPAHDDRGRPNFAMRDGAPVGHCFRCGHSRSWWVHVENRVGPGRATIEELARMAGVPPLAICPQAEAEFTARAKADTEKESFLAAARAALVQNAGTDVLAYLRERGYTEAECTGAELGAWPSPSSHFDLHGLGLDYRAAGDTHRLVIPLRDECGHLSGFALRALRRDAEPAKYLYSRSLPKSRLLPGLYLGRRTKGGLLLVEGVLDALIFNVRGIPTAALGSARLTGEQIAVLRQVKVPGGFLLSLDQDESGREGTESAVSELLAAGMRCYVVPDLPPGIKDPDEHARTEGTDAYRALLRRAEHGPRWLARRILARADIETEYGRSEGAEAVLQAALDFPPAARAVAASEIASILAIPPAAIEAEMAARAKTRRQEAANAVWRRLSADLARAVRLIGSPGAPDPGAIVTEALRQVGEIAAEPESGGAPDKPRASGGDARTSGAISV